ncbi:hypothetical protein SS50377_26317 [Spironucleus salmonicida]|nr:hypothetical protein SS50377_26317 [Spironucleus salmonicida]
MVSCFENMIDALYSAVAVLNQSSCSQKNLYLSNGQNLTLNIQFLENFVLKTLQIVQSIVSCQPTFKVILTLGMLTLYSNIKIKNCSINLFEQIIQEKNFKHLIIYQQDCGVLGVPVFEVLKTFLLQEKDQSLIDKALSFLVRIFNSNDTQIHEICKKNWGQIYDSIKNLNSLECGKLMSLMK